MALHPLDQLSHAIETLIAAATLPVTVMLVAALVVLAIDGAREHFAKRRARRGTSATRPRWSDQSRRVPPRTRGQHG